MGVNRWMTAFGETKTITEWEMDKRCVVSKQTAMYRVKHRGMSFEDAITTPTKKRHGCLAEQWRDCLSCPFDDCISDLSVKPIMRGEVTFAGIID